MKKIITTVPLNILNIYGILETAKQFSQKRFENLLLSPVIMPQTLHLIPQEKIYGHSDVEIKKDRIIITSILYKKLSELEKEFNCDITDLCISYGGDCEFAHKINGDIKVKNYVITQTSIITKESSFYNAETDWFNKD